MQFEIILCDIDPDVCHAWRRAFRGHSVSVEEGDFFDVAADAYVSPANSHGIMDGGLDLLLRNRFPGVESRVQRAIDARGGLLPVGQAVVVETGDSDVPYLVSAPTMIRPSSILGTRNVYLAMGAIPASIDMFNQDNSDDIRSVAIPGLGTGVGRMTPEAAASQMLEAYENWLSNR